MQKNKKNLIVLIPKFIFSGAGNSLFKLLKSLDLKKFDIKIICLNKCDYRKKLNKKINIYEINRKNLSSSIIKIFNFIRLNKKNDLKNIILSNHHYANVYAILISFIIKKLSIICVERTCIYELSHYKTFRDFIKKIFLRFMIKKVYKFSNIIISNTSFTKKEIEKFSSKNVKQIYPPTLKKIYSFKSKKIIKSFNILWVGRLDQEKGITNLIKIISKIDFNSNVFILGDGELKKYYISLANKFSNPFVKIFFKGYINDTRSYFKKSHLLINTSHFEGSNNSIIEALNYNLVILASNTPGGNREIIKKTSGILFNLDDEKSVLKKIKIIKNNYGKFQKKLKFKKIFLKNFLETKSNKSYLKILNSI